MQRNNHPSMSEECIRRTFILSLSKIIHTRLMEKWANFRKNKPHSPSTSLWHELHFHTDDTMLIQSKLTQDAVVCSHDRLTPSIYPTIDGDEQSISQKLENFIVEVSLYHHLETMFVLICVCEKENVRSTINRILSTELIHLMTHQRDFHIMPTIHTPVVQQPHPQQLLVQDMRSVKSSISSSKEDDDQSCQDNESSYEGDDDSCSGESHQTSESDAEINIKGDHENEDEEIVEEIVEALHESAENDCNVSPLKPDQSPPSQTTTECNCCQVQCFRYFVRLVVSEVCLRLITVHPELHIDISERLLYMRKTLLDTIIPNAINACFDRMVATDLTASLFATVSHLPTNMDNNQSISMSQSMEVETLVEPITTDTNISESNEMIDQKITTICSGIVQEETIDLGTTPTPNNQKNWLSCKNVSKNEHEVCVGENVKRFIEGQTAYMDEILMLEQNDLNTLNINNHTSPTSMLNVDGSSPNNSLGSKSSSPSKTQFGLSSGSLRDQIVAGFFGDQPIGVKEESFESSYTVYETPIHCKI